MKPLFVFFFALYCFLRAALADNKYPVVLVHGIAGWSRDELGGYKYWGRAQGDLQEQLKEEGYEVYTAVVGPFASNWDRACELFAYIKGGTVDYGLNHSTTFGHKRYGRTYPGLYSQWGTVVDGKVQKIHLIGHSMGGVTIRMMTQMLATGSKGAPTLEEPASNKLFEGGNGDWVHSITTVSSPNQGSLVADAISNDGDMFENVIAGLFSLLGSFGNTTTGLYDAKLDQWGIMPRQKNEKLQDYLERVFQSGIFKPGHQDICLQSCTTFGAKQENSWVTTLQNIYYYSVSNHDTHEGVDFHLRKVFYPNFKSMLLTLQPLSLFIGSRYGPNRGFNESWLPNDGVVSVPSMQSDGNGELVSFDGVSKPGRWHSLPLLEKSDHSATVGRKKDGDMFPFYRAHVELITSLP